MTKQEQENLQAFASWLKECVKAHKSRAICADSEQEYARHKGGCVAYDNALTKLENFFGDKLWR